MARSLKSRKGAPAAAVAAAVATGAAVYGLSGGFGDASAHENPVAAVRAKPSGTANLAAELITKSPVPVNLAAFDVRGIARPSADADTARRTGGDAARPSAPAKPATQVRHAKPAKPVKPAARTVTCSQSSSLLPANVSPIVTFLVRHGYSDVAAAGIAGNVYQESKGDPESAGMGGGGLIGFTPLPAGYVTGNPARDLQTQLSAILTFNQQWSAYLPALNSASSPAAAADIYVTDFERAGIPQAGTREAAAAAVAAACGL